ncbi:copper homeostasis membrane protein CopD [Ralstonia solanacearum]|uniref:copper homeostasis membrane protein CopD n=1 Tax=Ralstonia solanacearum TaxID=305 RepID=UPI0005ACFDC2|nr:copper homeostasis membrane protein CopD [Ralstonia solanacearum]MDC6177053.1 copper homeostasis membrane protein CopD [Ralstonia solanacearum]MDC6238415.1 copper homeostasis membrane protein CopD [Ralstonia solanacearum]
MPDDWFNIALRFALYLDLMILFGVSLFGTYALRLHDRSSGIARQYATVIATAAVFGMVLSLVSIVVMAKAMTGASEYSELSSHVFGMLLTGTGVGIAWAVRMGALVACLAAVAMQRRRPDVRFASLAGAAAVALATVAWGGHGAMDDGSKGFLHLASDVLHLVAAGAWIGALIAFVLLSFNRRVPLDHAVDTLSRTASGFARIGTLIVVILVVTGTINYLLIVGPTLQGLLTTLYGMLLLAKLSLFALMLGLAAANRYLLSPRLESAVRAGNHAVAVGLLRRSLTMETSLAVVIVVLVAWLGVLSPGPT